MNGHLLDVLVWAVGGLLGLVQMLVGFIVHLHIKNDDERWRDHEKITDERRQRFDSELALLRQRFHDLANKFAEIQTRLRWQDEDKKG